MMKEIVVIHMFEYKKIYILKRKRMLVIAIRTSRSSAAPMGWNSVPSDLEGSRSVQPLPHLWILRGSILVLQHSVSGVLRPHAAQPLAKDGPQKPDVIDE
ncbi:hypothetical protein PFDG_05260 [Plasmodium falciparum Dd2]|uniref:Uncharacterized protein n=1 Tax=Plasmodium falciparum (isolate Dd2) TaxID=57267 RepID=A0A0L7MA23_PLAF4|nr:hypothetical protein PFDG_05260 [Plasmodium falciparum Dd2]